MFTHVAALFVLAVSALAGDLLSVNNPSAVSECKAMTLTYQGGTGPYLVAALNADDPCGEPLVEFPSTKDTWINWKAANLTAGTKVIFSVEDSTQEEVWTVAMTVGKGDSTACHQVAAASTAPTTLVVPYSPKATNTPSTSGSSSSGNAPANVGSNPNSGSGAISAALPAVPRTHVISILGLVGLASLAML